MVSAFTVGIVWRIIFSRVVFSRGVYSGVPQVQNLFFFLSVSGRYPGTPIAYTWYPTKHTHGGFLGEAELVDSSGTGAKGASWASFGRAGVF